MLGCLFDIEWTLFGVADDGSLDATATHSLPRRNNVDHCGCTECCFLSLVVSQQIICALRCANRDGSLQLRVVGGYS